ncbi:hypothetical protein MNBD_IGNAVI01-270 [hydrothermal vent metagenome]|uniref:Lipoprotein n=1 Tax=hydrothermal vent metagenome TaxID=652676 RepID=A0A3B1D579_9ZZZZ
MKKLTLIPLIIFITLLFSCSSDDNPTEPVGQKLEPKAPTVKTIELPEHMAQSSDPHAQMAEVWIGMANSFTAFSGLFVPPEGAKSLPKGNALNDEGKYIWTVGPLSITLIYSSDDEYTRWKVIYNGIDNGSAYVNWVFMEAEQTADGNSGTLLMYKENSTELAAKWTWNNAADGSYDCTFIDQTDAGWKLDVHENADNSGEMNFYEDVNGEFILRYKITWNADGSGAWWDYENNESGSWQ